MPSHGEQYQNTSATVNPFVPPQQRVSEYTAQEIATLQSRLHKQLGPEYISTRQGPGGGRLHYLAADKVINLANEVFGFNGWSSAIQNVQIDFVDEDPRNGDITLGLSVIVRVTLRDGTYHEDIGYGQMKNCKGKAAAFEKAKKEGATDALKRALRNFGNVLGNCLYDKDYLQKVTKIKSAPAKWDADNLHRHADFVPIKKEPVVDAEAHATREAATRRQTTAQSAASAGSMEFDDDFGGAIFDETDFAHTDEVVPKHAATTASNPPSNTRQPQKQNAPAPRLNGQPPPMMHAQQPAPQPQRLPDAIKQTLGPAQALTGRAQIPQPLSNGRPNGDSVAAAVQMQQDAAARTAQIPGAMRAPPLANNQHIPVPQQQQQQITAPQPAPSLTVDENGIPFPCMPPPGNPDGFITGKAADLLNQAQGVRAPNAPIPHFDPHADSPSIRRTQGVNPGKSVPIKRQSLTGSTAAVSPAGVVHYPAPGPNGNTTPIRSNFVNPTADPNRKIGKPQPAMPPGVQTRGSYKPPTAVPVKRPPLSDVSNLQQTDGANDTKKVKVEAEVGQPVAPPG